MKLKRLSKAITILTLTLLTAFEAGATRAENPEAVISSLRQKLARARTPQDSLPTLYDIFDLTPRAARKEPATELYGVASRLGRDDIKLDIIRQMTNIYTSKDSALQVMTEAAKALPASEDQLSTLTFINIMREIYTARHSSERDRQQRLLQVLSHIDTGDRNDRRMTPQDRNHKLQDLFTVAVYLGFTTQEELLTRTLDRIDKLIEQMPSHLYALNNLYLTNAAISYTDMGRHDKAVEADRRLLAIIDELDKKYIREGRHYRDYTVSRYVCYRRMLHNQRALSSAQIEDIYRKVLDLAARNPEVRADMDRNHRAEICHLVANKDWEKAVALLRTAVDIPENKGVRRHLQRWLVEGAYATGDIRTQAEASRDYIAELEEYIENRAADHYTELQLMSELDGLKEKNSDLELTQLQMIHRQHHTYLVIFIILIPVLLAAVIGLLILYRRTRNLSRNLTASNSELKTERDNVLANRQKLVAARDRALAGERQKTEFINNMTHEIKTPLDAVADYSRLIADCVTDEKRPYLKKYVRLIDLNNEMVQRMISDVLDLAEVDNRKISIKPSPVEVTEACRMAIDTVLPQAPEGVTVRMARKHYDELIVNTDGARMEQVLLNLLNNAVKFTREGFVELDFRVEDSRLVFTVTDTGIGIPRDKDDIIFKRFEKLDRSTPGVGLGLPLARHIANLLGGDVTIDRTDTGRQGTRMVFTLPL